MTHSVLCLQNGQSRTVSFHMALLPTAERTGQGVAENLRDVKAAPAGQGELVAVGLDSGYSKVVEDFGTGHVILFDIRYIYMIRYYNIIMEKIRLRYRRLRVAVSMEKPLWCEACGNRGRLEFHHFKYEFSTAQVRGWPELVGLNGVWLCYRCHILADAMRKLTEDEARARVVSLALMSEGGQGWKRADT